MEGRVGRICSQGGAVFGTSIWRRGVDKGTIHSPTISTARATAFVKQRFDLGEHLPGRELGLVDEGDAPGIMPNLVSSSLSPSPIRDYLDFKLSRLK
jgi:hypothetical protein